MKFSILISSYNKGKYLESCIESCLSQTEENYEIILFDNNSTDNTDELLDKYSSKVKIVKKERISKHPAINQVDLIFNAFEVSTGSIICLLDADDYFSHNKLETIKNFFIRHSNVNTVFDLPILKYSDYQSKFILKKKIQKNIWPTIIPTSGISCSREFFYFFIKNSFAKTYKMLEIDFRLNVLSRIIDTNYEICEDIFYKWCEKSGYDNKRIKIICGLIFLNIAPLHHFPYSIFLYSLGRNLLKDFK